LKKPSAANSRSQHEPRSLPTFFVDRCLGDKALAQALRANGLTVEVHKDHFAPDAKDPDWLREAGRRKWVVLTKDKMLRYRETEIAALRAANVRAFVLTSGNLKADDMAAAFMKALPKMRRVLRKVKGSFIAKVTRAGGVEILQGRPTA
jgi:predicted nuclease of predicted toxin-antitoxin system